MPKGYHIVNDALSWVAIKRLVHQRATGCCEYCQTCEENSGQPMHVEHIIPNSSDMLENLCLACSSCNLSKATAISEVDPETGLTVSLFNPRLHVWSEHFEWVDDGIRIHGKTDIGRATVLRLKMNQSRLVRARRNWLIIGNHPPKI